MSSLQTVGLGESPTLDFFLSNNENTISMSGERINIKLWEGLNIHSLEIATDIGNILNFSESFKSPPAPTPQ